MSFSQNLDQLRRIDPILTEISTGYRNSDGVGTFIAPLVPMNARAGRTLVFGKESFANADLYRAPGAQFERVQAAYSVRSFALRQEAIGWEVTEEQASEAKTEVAQFDLRRFAVTEASKRLMQSHEIQVSNAVLDPSRYEATCVTNVAAADKWGAATLTK